MPSVSRQLRTGPFAAGGALAGSLLAGGIVVVLGAALAGGTAALSAGSAALVILAYFVSGALVQQVTLDLADATGLLITMVSYAVRVGLLGVLLWWAMSTPAIAQHFSRGWLAGGAISTLFGWLAGLLFTQSRARVPVYDLSYEPPKGWDE